MCCINCKWDQTKRDSGLLVECLMYDQFARAEIANAGER